ncbi:hypothetical protein [Brucella gallinifaecis]|uniref:hypothetical protein n=2 Tax=Brucella/Ochrobactrum group TaxID=2826938 RepID=UPI00235FF2CE|nr:hypothetical protein [Brucella gallinifaecis]
MIAISRFAGGDAPEQDAHRKLNIAGEIVHILAIAHTEMRQRTVNKSAFILEIKKRKRPRGRRMRGLILNTAGRRRCRIRHRALGGGVNPMTNVYP